MTNKENAKLHTGRMERLLKVTFYVLLAVYAISLCFMFYRQTQWTGGAVYESDLPAHISMVIEDGWYYSLSALVYRLLYFLPWPSAAIAVFLTGCQVLSVLLGGKLLNRFLHRDSLANAASLVLNFVMPCYLRGVADGRYIGMQSSAIWHNSTYIVMKPLALLTLICYVMIEEQIGEELQWKRWWGFMIALTLTTAVKPSFLLVFAPAMLVYLVVDLIRGVPFGRLFIFGCGVLPSLAVVLIQNAVLFGGSTGNGWELAPGAVLAQHSAHPLISAVLSILFPLVMLEMNPQMVKSKYALGAWMMAVIGFLQLFLFSETGSRAMDGNFMWGYSFAILPIFIVGIYYLLTELRRWAKLSMIRKAALCAACAILLWHLYCGLYFYINLVQGVSYFMWD